MSELGGFFSRSLRDTAKEKGRSTLYNFGRALIALEISDQEDILVWMMHNIWD